MARDAVSDVAKQLHAIVDDARELCATARRGLVAQSDQHNSPSGEEANSHEQDQTVNSVLSVLLQGAAMKRNSLTTAADVSARRTSLRALGEVLCVGESSGSSGKSDTSAESPVQDTRAVAALAAPRPVVGFTSRRQSEEEIGPRLDSFMGDGFLRGALKSSRGAKEPDIIVSPTTARLHGRSVWRPEVEHCGGGAGCVRYHVTAHQFLRTSRRRGATSW